MKKLFFSVLFVSCVYSMVAQEYKFLNEGPDKPAFFNHLDASLTLGTTGIGFDVATPVGDFAQLRAGYAFMPRFHYPMNFPIQVGDVQESKYDAEGNRVETKFDRLAAILENLTGYKTEDHVEMIGQPTYHNVKVLVDVFPFKRDKRWYVSAGFFLGPSRIAKAYNVTEAMPSLLAVGIYNRLYDNTMISYESLSGFPRIPVISIGDFGITDENTIKTLYNMMISNGRMGMKIGNKTNSDGAYYLYLMEPDEDGMAKAVVKTRSFKPYLGIGYGGRLLKNNDRAHIAVDLGAMFWGGTASVITHDGTNLSKDVTDIGGKVGDYVSLIKAFKVFPVLDVRFVYSIF